MKVSLNDLKDRHPQGVYCEEHGCYYFVDMDVEVGYYIESRDGLFFNEINYVDFDVINQSESNVINTALAYSS